MKSAFLLLLIFICIGVKAQDTISKKIEVNVGGSTSIENVDASKITTGTLSVDRLPASYATLSQFKADSVTKKAAIDANATTILTKITANAPILPGTATKITYTGNGLVAAGTGLAASDIPVSEYFALTSIASISAGWNTTTLSNISHGALAVTNGTSAAKAWSASNFLTRSRRLVYTVQTSTAGQFLNVRTTYTNFWRGNAAGLGGFDFFIDFGVDDLPTNNTVFIGLWSGTGSTPLATDQASALFNTLGIGKDVTDANTWSFIYNDNSGTGAKINTGLSINTSSLYRLRITCAPNDVLVNFSLVNLATGAMFTHTATTDLPPQDTPLGWMLHESNVAAATGVFGLTFSKMTVVNNN